MEIHLSITRGHTIALFKIITLGLLLGLGIQFLFAWTAPSGVAPTGNVAGPLTTNAVAQYKQGPLGINTSMLPGAGYGLRLGGNALIGGKVYSSPTVDGDLSLTLATKGYVDGKVGGGFVWTPVAYNTASFNPSCFYSWLHSGGSRMFASDVRTDVISTAMGGSTVYSVYSHKKHQYKVAPGGAWHNHGGLYNFCP